MKKLINYFRNTLGETKVMRMIASILMLLLIFFLLDITGHRWGQWFRLFRTAIQPFLIGFILSYILTPFVRIVEKYVKSRGVAVLIVIFLFIGFVIGLVLIAFPQVISQFISLLNSGVSGLDAVIKYLKNQDNTQLDAFLKTWGINLESFLTVDNLSQTVKTVVSNSGTFILQLLMNFATIILSFMIYTILTIYFLVDEKNIKRNILKFAGKIDVNLPLYLINASKEVRNYLKSFGLIMLIKAPQYMFLYFIIGHRNWFILGLLNMVSILIPYIGPISVNILSVVTALNQSPAVVIGSFFVIGWSSFVDQYLIEPRIYGKRVKLNPLVLLFGIFASGTLFGLLGVVIAIPSLLIIRSVYRTYVLLNPKAAQDIPDVLSERSDLS